MPESKHFYQNNKHSQTPLQSPCKNGCTPLIVNHMSFPHSLQHSFFVNCFGDYSLTRLSARILGFVFSRTMFFSCCCSPRPALLKQWTKVRREIISWGRRLMESGVVWFGEPLWFLLRWQISCAHNVHRLVKVTCLKSAARRRSRGVMADPDGWANGGIVAFELGLLPSTYENNTCIRRRSMS